ncbi:DUF6622 family protein [Ramlibacter sp.]|uniref:DUF6622 family protein n=1 Tax=Ramlibacter sp. TaxID=1917967 RepID=UPI001846488E|nr:DUF6622 family protein [Ramlibacter sp.]MBA2672999.1 hypothetical protein [Ramlibacter sp.]
MLLQIVTHNPQMLGTIVKNTPPWVWGLLAGLIALGISQARERSASLARTAIMPVAMTVFSLWGLFTAFGNSAQLAGVAGAWLAAAATVFVLVARIPQRGRYDAGTRIFTLPGSFVPLALILAIFVTRYAINVELALDPRLAADSQFALACAALYGALSGIFTGRAAGLWRLTGERSAAAPVLAQ